jgi:hypothetical protein
VLDSGRVVSQGQVVGDPAGSCGGSREVLSNSGINECEHRRLAFSWQQRRPSLHGEGGDLRGVRVRVVAVSAPAVGGRYGGR